MQQTSKWGDYFGQYTYDIDWRGVPLTVEAEVPTYDPDAIFPVRVLAGGVDITDLIDLEDGGLCDQVQAAHEGYDMNTELAVHTALLARMGAL